MAKTIYSMWYVYVHGQADRTARAGTQYIKSSQASCRLSLSKVQGTITLISTTPRPRTRRSSAISGVGTMRSPV